MAAPRSRSSSARGDRRTRRQLRGRRHAARVLLPPHFSARARDHRTHRRARAHARSSTGSIAPWACSSTARSGRSRRPFTCCKFGPSRSSTASAPALARCASGASRTGRSSTHCRRATGSRSTRAARRALSCGIHCSARSSDLRRRRFPRRGCGAASSNERARARSGKEKLGYMRGGFRSCSTHSTPICGRRRRRPRQYDRRTSAHRRRPRDRPRQLGTARCSRSTRCCSPAPCRASSRSCPSELHDPRWSRHRRTRRRVRRARTRPTAHRRLLDERVRPTPALRRHHRAHQHDPDRAITRVATSCT